MAVKTVEQLVIQMKAIMHQWHDSARVGNQGAAGNTLEDLLGVPENNLRLPDFGKIELKAKQFEGKAGLITLFHKSPKSGEVLPLQPRKPRAVVQRLAKSMGWRHKEAGGKHLADEMRFSSTTYGHYFSVRGFTLTVDTEANRIVFVYDPQQVKRDGADVTEAFATYGDWADSIELRTSPYYGDVLPVYYDVEDLITIFKSKLDHTLLALYKTRVHEKQKQFWFEEAYLMKDIRPEQIIVLLKDGSMAIDFDARTRHDHGTKIRIKKDKAHLLFTDFRLME